MKLLWNLLRENIPEKNWDQLVFEPTTFRFLGGTELLEEHPAGKQKVVGLNPAGPNFFWDVSLNK